MAPRCPSCGQKLESAQDECPNCGFEIPQEVLIGGRYRIVEPYCFTPSGAAYKAEEADNPGVYFSLREVLARYTNFQKRREAAEKFINIARSFSPLEHPNLARLVDSFAEGNYLYLVYEYVDGKDLAKITADHRFRSGMGLPEELVVHWALQICDLLAYLHGSKPDPVFCVDLAPSSLVLCVPEEKVYYINLGVPYLISALQPYSPISEGTLSSRRLESECLSVDWDLLCLGKTMYHLLTGEDPPPRSETPPDLRGVRPDISRTLEEIVLRVLGSSRLPRFTQAQDLRQELSGRCRALPLFAFDLYNEMVNWKKKALQTEWPTFQGNLGRTGSVGPGPKYPLYVRWQARTNPAEASYLVYHKGNVLYCSESGVLNLYGGLEGSLRWQLNLKKPLAAAPIICRDTIFASPPDRDLQAISMGGEGIKATFETESPVLSSPSVWQDTLFVAAYDGTIYALSLRDGSLLWKNPMAGRVIAPPLAAEDMVYVPSLNGYIYGLDDVGRLQWEINLEGSMSCAPAFWQGRVLVGTHRGTVVSIDTGSGDVLWRGKMEGTITLPPLCMQGRVYFVSSKGTLVCLEVATAKPLWKANLERQPELPMAITNNTIYLLLQPTTLLALDEFTGDTRFTLDLPDKASSPPLIANAHIYIATASGMILAYG